MTRMSILLILGVITLACKQETKPGYTSPHNSLKIKQLLPLSEDSGFVTKKIGLPFLIAHQLTDTTGVYWNDLKSNDTIAKYYRLKDNGHFLYCTVDYNPDYIFETRILLELNQSCKILQVERYYNGNYACCWANLYEGFQKYGDYFGIKTCSTGSGFCASNLYLFEKLTPQDSLEPIVTDYYEAMGGADLNPRVLKSTFSLKKDELRVNYTLEEGVIGHDDQFKVQKTKRFTVPYRRRGISWVAQDSTMFKSDILW